MMIVRASFLTMPGPVLVHSRSELRHVAQVHDMTEKLAQFTDIRAALVVGGMSLSIQASTLRSRPEIVVGTPVSSLLSSCACLPAPIMCLKLNEQQCCAPVRTCTQKTAFSPLGKMLKSYANDKWLVPTQLR